MLALEFVLCIEPHMEKSVMVRLVLIKAELGFLESRCTEAYWLMFLLNNICFLL